MTYASDSPGAVILGGSISSLGAARCLAKYGISVFVLGNADSVVQYSRSVSRFTSFPPNLKDEEIPDYLVDYLVKMAEKPGVKGSVLFPSSDIMLRVVAQHNSLLAEHYVLTTLPWETVKFLYDKRLTYTLAREARVAMPQSHVLGDADQLAALDVDFPVVIKPAIAPRFWRSVKKKAFRADNREELQACYEAMSRVIGSSEVIVQDFLPNPSRNLFSFAGYFMEGEPIVGLSIKRARQFPKDFGLYNTFAEAVDVPELRELASQLLRSIHYTGLAEVEFMWDEKQSCFKLLEVNARLWESHSLAAAAGLDLPYVAFAAALGKDPPLGAMREGTKWFRLLSDVLVAAHDIRAGTLSIRQYLSSFRGPKTFAVLSASDPAPFVAELFGVLRRRLEKLAQR